MNEIIFDQAQKFHLENEKVNNEQNFHQIGTIIENDQEDFVKVNPVEGEGFALFGLYNFYPIGKYIVEFEIYHTDEQIDKTHLNSPVAIVDISINAGERVLAKKEVKFKDLLYKQKTRLDFYPDAPSVIGHRVLSLGILPFMIGIKPRVLPLQQDE